jgi:hypothetical protein
MKTKLNLNKYKEGQVVLVKRETSNGPVVRLAVVSHFFEEDIEEHVYNRMCSGCERARYCHEECETCEEYDEAIEELEKDEDCPKAFYEYALQDSDATYCFTAYESDLLPIENEQHFTIIRKSSDKSNIKLCPARQLASRILGQLELYGDFYYQVEDWLTDFLEGNEHDMPYGIESEYLRMALRVEVRDYLDSSDIEYDSEDVENIVNDCFDCFGVSVLNDDFIQETVARYVANKEEN